MTGAGTSMQAESLAEILRHLRHSRCISQMELGLRLGVSQRHVSFVELGRANPSRSLILSWARETGATSDELNAALASAGYAPGFVELGTVDLRNSPSFQALSGMLLAHDPNPGLIFDADWKIRAMNPGGQRLCSVTLAGFLADLDTPIPDMDMIAAVAHPGGLLSTARNAAEVGFALLNQLRTEQLTRPTLRPRIDALEASLLARYGEAPDTTRAPGETHLQFIADTRIGTLRFLLVQSVFGLPINVNRNSLRSELWFPIDEATRKIMMRRCWDEEGAAHGAISALLFR